MLKINGVKVKSPESFQVDISDLDGEATRNAKGEMIRDRIAIKRKLSIEWGLLDMNEISTLLQAVKDEFFICSYPDPMEGKVVTKTFYVGDRSAPYYSDVFKKWTGLSMNFTEK